MIWNRSTGESFTISNFKAFIYDKVCSLIVLDDNPKPLNGAHVQKNTHTSFKPTKSSPSLCYCPHYMSQWAGFYDPESYKIWDYMNWLIAFDEGERFLIVTWRLDAMWIRDFRCMWHLPRCRAFRCMCMAFASLSCRDLVKELVHVALLFILRLVIDFSEFGNCERVKSRSQIYFYACRIFKFCSTQFLLINTGRTHLANLRLLLVNKYLSNLLIHSQAQRDSGQDWICSIHLVSRINHSITWLAICIMQWFKTGTIKNKSPIKINILYRAY